MLTKEFINPTPMGFSEVVTYTSNGVKTIIISGQVGHTDGEIPEDFAEQVDIAFRNLVGQLEAASATIEDLVKVNMYVVNIDKERGKAVRDARKKYIDHENKPASTLVGVSALVFPNILFEIEGTAIIEA